MEGNEYTGTVYADFEDYPYGNLWNFDGDPSDPDCRIVHEYWGDEEIKTVRIAEGQSIHPASTYSWFHMCDSIESLDLSHFDTSKVISMSSLFYGCSKLESLDISGFDTGNTINIGGMFCGCLSLTSADVSTLTYPKSSS
ncbi:MAG: BspA family leucine-rich repeat surface protein [Erysipelotrichaceae bacterium]|nr:BspA family leucine-rich repeat surface protein [Erysipelotrichaceae bacterium]